MDYKYIEQLLKRYWACETSAEEEQALRSFFCHEEVPAHLLRYRAWFAYQEAEREKGLGKDFDAKVLAQIGETAVRAERIPRRVRLTPLFKAAAVVGVLFAMGTVTERSIEKADDNGTMIEEVCQEAEAGTQTTVEPVLPIDTVVKMAVDETGTTTEKN